MSPHAPTPTTALDSPLSPPTVLVIGAGAVGGFYGAALARAGAHVTTLHRSDYEQVRQYGIRIDGLDRQEIFHPHRVIDRLEALPDPPDFLLVSLKALPDPPVAEIIRPAVGDQTAIILLQNGLDIEEPVQTAFPEHEIIAGLAFVCLQKIAPGHIRHLCHGKITLGRHPSGISPKVRQLAALFTAAGLPCQITDTPARARWIKLVWNAAFNPTSVLAGDRTTEEILRLPEGEKLVRDIMREVIEIAAAHGHDLPEGLIEAHLEATRSIPPYHTSMALDHLAGRAMETDAILGAAVRAARRVGHSAPLLEGLWALMRLLEGDGIEKSG
ncbi:2-dehydropantoate 2-reductase [Candidatus Magnetaquicoccaceae bacterium FCR-1]|uniref:2-dehydropantoate 2-reductase n=1 Tax=Candidatus Magnetaquiglobus chichijimensis TaxID=3141448 RepID=A0ABQ0CA16_9PROT